MTDRILSVQQTYAPNNQCFGCGPANSKGLQIASFEDGEALVCTWHAEPHHQAFAGMLNGGICGALLDCHSNWTAAIRLMRRDGLDAPPCTVTSDFAVKLKRPTPLEGPIQLRAWIADLAADRATVDAELIAGGKVTATCRGLFVAVREGHPAYHRW